MTGTIARRIQLELTRNQRIHLASADPVDPPSYEAYLMGRYHWNKRTLEGFRKGIEYFERALVLRPEYAAAHAGLADCYNMLGDYDILAPEESFRVAQSSARKAIALDEGLAEAHASLAFALMHYDWNWEEVEKEYLRAIALNPNYATAHHWYALYLTTRKRFDEAAEEMNKAKALDPLSLIIITNTGWLRYFMRDYDAAATLYNEGLQMDADFLSAHTKLAWAYEEQKKYRNAIDELQKSLSISAGDRALELMLARAYALSGDKGKARAILTRIEKESRKTYVSPYYVALAYAGLHDSDRAFGWLQEAARERNSWLIWLAVDPRLDALRTDPRFDELVRRVGLEAVRQGGEGSWVRGQGEGSRQ
jgi:tetratricopeptide (TPR) repeat protein